MGQLTPPKVSKGGDSGRNLAEFGGLYYIFIWDDLV